ncbi:ribosome-binding factor A [Candidatus Parcubacteria bacterium]|nr:ribosome-binding factor A [Candidatus Parcubacteria bacterium]
MNGVKREKIEEILRHLAAEFILREATSASLITVTRVALSDTAKVANIYFTTLPDSEEDTALKFLQRKAPEFKDYARDNSRVGMLPELRFQIDYGERNRQKLDDLSRGLE